ncbi:unnamed protein product [Dimorphilus gyrociliatus]|nr:unnamed protein product [Dimorphilus gyrociliatus]
MAADGMEYDDPLRIADESSEEQKFEISTLEAYFPGKSGDTDRENFDPVRYLLEKYAFGCTMEDLKAGVNQLRASTTSKSFKPLMSFKTHIKTLIDCENALNELKLQLDKDQMENSIIKHLEEAVVKANLTAMAAFEGVLCRRERAENITTGLGALNRLRLLFELPKAIEREARRGRYEAVITDYSRARTQLARDGERVPEVLQKVFKEVETRMALFRESLLNKLKSSPNTPFEVQKRYLNILEAAGDNKASICVINNLAEWIMKELDNTGTSSSLKKIESLSSTLVLYVLRLWRLASIKSSEEHAKNLILDILRKYSETIRQVVASTEKTSEGKSSPAAVRILQSVRSNIDCLPKECLTIIEHLSLNVRITCTKSLLENALRDVAILKEREDWNVEDDGKGSHLPRLFETLVTDVLQQIREIVTQEPQIFKVQPKEGENIRKLLVDLSKSFSSVLEELSNDKEHLVILLANCDYTCNRVIPNLKDTMEACLKIECSNIDIEASKVYKKQRMHFLKDYIDLKTKPILSELFEQLQYSGFDSIQNVTSTRPYVTYFIVSVCQILSEICLVGEQLVQDVLTPICSVILGEYAKKLGKIKNWGISGALQCQVDVQCLKAAFQAYVAQKVLTRLNEVAPKISVSEAKHAQKIVADAKSSMSLQIDCLTRVKG